MIAKRKLTSIRFKDRGVPAMEVFMNVVTYLDSSSVRQLLKAFPFIQKTTRLLVDTFSHSPIYFKDEKLKLGPSLLFHEFDPKTKRPHDITLIELSMPAVSVILAHPERYINHFDPLTFIHVEIDHFEFQLWKFLELIKSRGAHCSLEREERWVREAPLAFTNLDLAHVQEHNLVFLHIHEVQSIGSLKFYNLECLQITFKPGDTPPVISNILAPFVADFRVHFQGAIPEFSRVQVGIDTPFFSPKPVGGIRFELADSRCLEYACNRAYDSTRYNLHHLFASDFSFTASCDRITLIGVPNCVINRCDFSRLKRLTWRCTSLFQGDEECHDIKPGRGESKSLYLHYESNVPGSTLPLFQYPVWNTVSVKDSIGNLNINQYHNILSFPWKLVGALAIVSEPWCPLAIPHYSPLYGISKYHTMFINILPDVKHTLDIRSEFVFIALGKLAISGTGYTIRLKSSNRNLLVQPPSVQGSKPKTKGSQKEKHNIHMFAIYVIGLVPQQTLGKLFRIQYDPGEYKVDYVITGNGLRDPQAFSSAKDQTNLTSKSVSSISAVFKTLVSPGLRR